MAERIAKMGIIVNGTTLTSRLKDLDISYDQEIHDITAMDDEARQRLVGFQDYSITAGYWQDFATGSVDETHFSLLGNTGFTVTVRVESSADRSSTNPEYAGTFVLESGVGPSGSAGDPMEASFTYKASGGSAFARSVAST